MRPFGQGRLGNDDPVYYDACNGQGHNSLLGNAAVVIVTHYLAASALPRGAPLLDMPVGISRRPEENGTGRQRGQEFQHGLTAVGDFAGKTPMTSTLAPSHVKKVRVPFCAALL